MNENINVLLKRKSELPDLIDTVCDIIDDNDYTMTNITPLHMASDNNQPEIAHLLLSAGADTNIVTVGKEYNDVYRQSPLCKHGCTTWHELHSPAATG